LSPKTKDQHSAIFEIRNRLKIRQVQNKKKPSTCEIQIEDFAVLSPDTASDQDGVLIDHNSLRCPDQFCDQRRISAAASLQAR